MARADSEAGRRVEHGQRWIDSLPIHQRLTHPHEDDIRHWLGWVEKLHLANLTGDLEHLKVAREAHRACRAERALKRAPRLRRNAERKTRAFRNRDGLDELAVAQTKKKLLGAITRGLSHGELEARSRKVFFEQRPERHGKVRHRREGLSRILPQMAYDLRPAKWLFPMGNRELP